jgi:hypothetical protein
MPEKNQDAAGVFLNRLDQALAGRDTGTLLALLAETRSFPEQCAYEQRERFFALQGPLLDLLLKELGPDPVLEKVDLALFQPARVYHAFNRWSRKLSRDHILTLVNRIGPPPDKAGTALKRVLVTDPDPAVTLALDRIIRQRSTRVREQGSSYTDHLKTLSTFQYVHWGLPEEGLGSLIGLMAQRPDAEAANMLRTYLAELPWGEDREATVLLLNHLAEARTPENETALNRALTLHPDPSRFRLFLWWALQEYNTIQGVKGLLADLDRIQDADLQMACVNLLDARLKRAAAEPDLDIAPDEWVDDLAGLKLEAWDRASRGFLDRVVRNHGPKARVGGVSSLDQWVFRLVAAFDRRRLEHMGGLVKLVFLGGAALGVSWLLDWLILPLRWPWTLVDWVGIGLWLLALTATAHTHFSGHETLPQQTRMALVFWGTAVFWPLAMVGTRLVRLWSPGG